MDIKKGRIFSQKGVLVTTANMFASLEEEGSFELGCALERSQR